MAVWQSLAGKATMNKKKDTTNTKLEMQIFYFSNPNISKSQNPTTYLLPLSSGSLLSFIL
jgi:hypothetical protein